MLKIRSRIALLYSLLTIILIIFCIVLFYCFLKFNINKQPIISSLIFNNKEPVQTVTASKKKLTPDGEEALNNNIVIVQKSKNTSNSNTIELNTESTNNITSFTERNFEKLIMNNLYSRFFIIISIVISIILFINFVLSRKYASFALSPLIEFTGKVKQQGSFKTIELMETPKAKDEIYDLTVAYNEALGKIKLSYENLQRLNSYVSHELRNSLAVLRAKIEIGEDTVETTAYIDRLNGVISDILAMSTSSLSNSQESVDLALVCAKLVDEYSVVFKNIKFNMPEEGVETISGKESWIERCIVNLLDNAIKFMDENKSSNDIKVQIYEDKENIFIEIYDNGIGIDECKFDEIFTPYYGTQSRTSTGIGLAYIKHIMDLHRGKVLVESKKGEYSKFTLVFQR